MKKSIKVLLVVFVLLFGICVVTGCDKDTNKKESTKTEEKKKDPIVGSWEYEGGSYVYTFNEDGSGNYLAGKTKMEFTYKVDGSKLSITYKGNTTPFETTFTIKDEVLTIKDSFDNDVVYKKK